MGVDVEKIRTFRGCERLAMRFFAADEQEYIFAVKGDNERAERFTKIWTLKECYLKYLGSGLSESLESFSADAYTGKIKESSGKIIAGVNTETFSLDGEYILSVCGNEDNIFMKTVSEQEL